MAEGYVVAEKNDYDALINFWNGFVLQASLQEAVFITDKVNARLAAGGLQSSYPEKEIAAIPAQQVLQISVGQLAASPQAAQESESNDVETSTQLVQPTQPDDDTA